MGCSINLFLLSRSSSGDYYTSFVLELLRIVDQTVVYSVTAAVAINLQTLLAVAATVTETFSGSVALSFMTYRMSASCM